MYRHDFLRALLALPLAALPAACQHRRTRQEVLSGLVREIIVPNTKQLVPVSSALREASAALAVSPTLQALRVTREAWRRAALAWKTAGVFPQGPLVESKALQRASYWPVLSAAIEALVSAKSELDEPGIEEISLNQRGVYALEYLLFPLASDESRTLGTLAGGAGERRRQLIRALAQDLALHAERALRMLGDGSAYAGRFERGGQQSVSLLLAELILCIETFAVNRVDLVLTLAERRLLRPSDVEGWPSGSSHRLLEAVLVATEQLYRGRESGGLSDLVRAVAPAVDERVQIAFQNALSSVKRLGIPLEQGVTQNPGALRAALNAAKALEVAIKVDAASALGVTLTFQSGDGD